MRTRLTLTLAAALASSTALALAHDPAAAAPAALQPAAGDLDAALDALSSWDGRRRVVHEWGTFVSVQGSDGSVLAGLLHEEHDLPSFVHDLRDLTGLTAVTPKMETPVIYFYSPDAWRVEVDVRFPRGAITQWYPLASDTNHQPRVRRNGPAPEPDGRVLAELRDGFIRWGSSRELLVMSPEEAPELPAVAADDPWRFSREVDANFLRVCGAARPAERREAPPPEPGTTEFFEEYDRYEYERLLFYRGLGDFPLPLKAQVWREEVEQDLVHLELGLAAGEPGEVLRFPFLIFVEDGRAAFVELPDLGAALHVGPLSLELGPVEETTERLVERVARRLIECGLYGREALAMARTWQQGWFADEGLRLLYVLPEEFVERELPLGVRPHEVWPSPEDWAHGGPANLDPALFELESEPGPQVDELCRVFVGRTELLSPRREGRLVATIEGLGAPGESERERARQELEAWGRFAAPYLQRALALPASDDLRSGIERELERHRLRR